MGQAAAIGERPRNRRQGTLTTVWTLSLDAVAAGLIVMVFGSYVMWFLIFDEAPRVILGGSLSQVERRTQKNALADGSAGVCRTGETIEGVFNGAVAA